MAIAEIRLRRGEAADWATLNPVLALGEPGYDLDEKRLKVGDGVTPWLDLAFQGIDEQLINDTLTAIEETAGQVAAVQSAAADVELLVANVHREEPNGLAGLDGAGLLIPSHFPVSIQRQVPNGVAGLDGAGKVIDTALPDSAKTRQGGRPVERGEDRINVREFGALGDGVADDTSEIADAALAAAASPSRTLYFPRGTYLGSSFPDIPSGVNVDAEEGAVFKLTAAVTYFQNFAGKTKQVWKNLEVDLNGKPTSSGFRFHIGSYGLRFENVSVTSSAPMPANVYGVDCATGCVNINWRGGRIYSLLNPVRVFSSAARVWFRKVEILGYGNRGIFVNASSTGGAEAGSQDLWVTGCTITDPGWFRTVTNKQVVGGIGTLTLAPSPTGEPNPYVGGMITDVRGVGAPFDGVGLTVLGGVNAPTATTVKFDVAGGDIASTAVVQSGNFPPAVQMAGDPRQPIAVQNANFSGTMAAPGTNNPAFRHKGLRITGNKIKGIPGIAHHLTLTGDPEAGSLLGGTADAISVHGADSPMVEENIVEDSGEVGITIANFTILARVALNKLRRANTNAVCFQNVLQCSNTDNEAVDCGGDYGASAAPRSGSHTAFWVKDSPDSYLRGNRCHDTLANLDGTARAAIQTMALYLAGTNNAGSEIGLNPLSGGTTILCNPLSTSTGKTGVRWDLPFREVEVPVGGDQSTAPSDTTQIQDNTLLLTFEAYGVYDIDGTSLGISATAAGDAAISWDAATIPADTTLEWSSDGPGTTSTSAGAALLNRQKLNKASVAPVGGGGAGDMMVFPKGRLKAGATGGTLRLKFGQNAVDPVAVIRRAGSRLRMKRVG